MRQKIKMKTKSRAKFQCPPELERLISMANLISPDAELKKPSDWNEYQRRFQFPLFLSFEEKERLATEEKEKVFSELFIDFDEGFKKAVLTLNEAELRETFNLGYVMTHLLIQKEFFAVYEFFYDLRHNLRLIDRFFSQLREGDNLFVGESEIIIKTGEVLVLPRFQVSLSREGTKGKIGTNQILHLEDVDLDRIRLCRICKRIFWAKRSDSHTCSKPCQKAYEMKIYRDKHKEEINKKRRENYAYNKKIKKAKAKKTKGGKTNAL